MATEGYRASNRKPETCFAEDDELALATPRCLALLYNRVCYARTRHTTQFLGSGAMAADMARALVLCRSSM